MTITEADLQSWRGHVGRSETRRQRLDGETARRYAAALNADLDVERSFPPLGHWAFFLDAVSPEAIGPDGHPRRRGGIMPNVSLARRMFAGATLRFDAPLVLDQDAQLTTTVADIRHRSGRSGELVFVEVDRVISQSGATCVTERQTIVYRAPSDPHPPIIPVDLPSVEGEAIWTPTSVDLFRFSAVTFNSHRIHYDLPYATGEEGYPGLVVHGPYTAARLFALAQRGGRVAEFSFQAKAPLFSPQSVRLRSVAGGVEAVRCDGAVAMTAFVHRAV